MHKMVQAIQILVLEHWETKQNGSHFVNHLETKHHWKTEPTPTI